MATHFTKGFKRFCWLFALLLSTLFIAECGSNINVSWVYYEETACADKWASTNNNEVLKDNITSYFKSRGIRIYELEIFTDGPPENCQACFCKTGRVIKAKVKNRDVDNMKAENFYQ